MSDDVKAAATTKAVSSPKQRSSEASERPVAKPDRFLAPLPLDERSGEIGPVLNLDRLRCSDKGFLPMSLADYFDLLDWTGRQLM